jgi:hypothetical protein
MNYKEHAVVYLVETLCYKPQGTRLDSRRQCFFFSLPNIFSHTMVIGFDHCLTDLSTKNSKL